jgi:hypothetical protein
VAVALCEVKNPVVSFQRGPPLSFGVVRTFSPSSIASTIVASVAASPTAVAMAAEAFRAVR